MLKKKYVVFLYIIFLGFGSCFYIQVSQENQNLQNKESEGFLNSEFQKIKKSIEYKSRHPERNTEKPKFKDIDELYDFLDSIDSQSSEKALVAIKDFLEAHPSQKDAAIVLANVLAFEMHAPFAAIAILEEFVRARVDYEAGVNLLSILYGNNDSTGRGIEFFGHLRDRGEDSPVVIRHLAMFLMHDERYEEAVPVLEALKPSTQKWDPVLQNLAEAYVKTSQVEKGIETIKRDIERINSGVMEFSEISSKTDVLFAVEKSLLSVYLDNNKTTEFEKLLRSMKSRYKDTEKQEELSR